MLSGLELKINRIKANLKVKDIAKHLGVHYTYISKLEDGKQSIPEHIYDKWFKLVCN